MAASAVTYVARMALINVFVGQLLFLVAMSFCCCLGGWYATCKHGTAAVCKARMPLVAMLDSCCLYEPSAAGGSYDLCPIKVGASLLVQDVSHHHLST